MNAVVGILLVASGGVGAAFLLRRAGFPGARVAGGVLAGVLLGPSVFGRMAPEPFDRLIAGAPEAREHYRQIQREASAFGVLVMKEGAAPEAVREQLAERATALEAAASERSKALWEFEAPARMTVSLLAAVVLAGLGVGREPGAARGKGAERGSPTAVRLTRRALWRDSFAIGVWAAVVPALLAMIVLRLCGMDVLEPSALLVASAVAVGATRLAEADRSSAEQVESGGATLLAWSTRFASLAAIALVAWALIQDSHREVWEWLTVVGGLLIGWIRADAGLALGESGPSAGGRSFTVIAEWIALPALAALISVRFEIFLELRFWPLMAFVLLSGDGRWLGAFGGACIPQVRRNLRSARLVLGMMAAGPAQLSFAAVATYTNLLEPWLIACLVFGAVMIETAAPLRRGAAERLIELEEELPQRDDPAGPR